MSDNWLQQAIRRQRAGLSARLREPLSRIAGHCVSVWEDCPALEQVLVAALPQLSPCHLLYAVNADGTQRSANITADGLDATVRGQNLADRPYLTAVSPDAAVALSEVYISRVTQRPCVTAVQPIANMGHARGYLAADFALRDLPVVGAAHAMAGDEQRPARQIKGDPAIRSTVFEQRRVDSDMDRSMTSLLAIMDELIGERGVFHAKLHFSSSRATLWLTDDPYRYRVHVLREIIDPSVCLAYPPRAYPEQAVVERTDIMAVFERLALLRRLDDTFYLRSGSLNIINGMVGLTFSCDGTYYLAADEFLATDERFWVGA